MQRLCHPVPVLNLGNTFAIQFTPITCMSKLSQQNTPLWFYTSRFRFVLPVTCSKLSNPFSTQFLSLSHDPNRQTFPMTSSRHAQTKILSKAFEHRASSWIALKFNPNTFKLTLQISSPRFPLLLFTLSHTPTHRLHYRSLHLSWCSTKSYCCSSWWTPCQLSSSTRCWSSLSTKRILQEVHHRPKVLKTLQCQNSTKRKHLVHKFHRYQ